ncbi:MAG: hypothetical protein ACE5FI_13705 [Anaerolineales bacterium]
MWADGAQVAAWSNRSIVAEGIAAGVYLRIERRLRIRAYSSSAAPTFTSIIVAPREKIARAYSVFGTGIVSKVELSPALIFQGQFVDVIFGYLDVIEKSSGRNL